MAGDAFMQQASERMQAVPGHIDLLPVPYAQPKARSVEMEFTVTCSEPSSGMRVARGLYWGSSVVVS